jgi:uncharacterized phage protein gp47/JayE
MSFGVQLSGFIKKTLNDILTDIQDFQLDNINSTLNLLANSVLGQLNGVMSDKISELWDVAEAVYRSFYPDSATGDALDGVAALTGVVRLEPTSSTVTLDQIFLENGTTVPLGSIVSVGSIGERFVTTAAVTNSLGYEATFSVAAEAENTGPISGFARTIDTIQTPVSGWLDKAAVSAGNSETYALDGKSLTLQVDQGSTQTVNFTGGDPWTAASSGTFINGATTGVNAFDDGNGTLRVESTTSGPGSAIQITGGSANTPLNFPTTLVKGFNSTDAEPGTDLETDEELRVRRERLLRALGSATVEAIRARLLEVEGVTNVSVFENVTDVTDSFGLPPHSFESIVLGGTNVDIAESIWENKPAGIETYGSVSQGITDSQGISHTIKFSRPTTVTIYMTYTLDTTPDYPADGDTQVKAAAVAAGDLLQVGDDVVALQFKSLALDITGVFDVTDFRLGTSPSPTGTSNISIDPRQIADIDSANITVS